jgi:hypothetical protein
MTCVILTHRLKSLMKDREYGVYGLGFLLTLYLKPHPLLSYPHGNPYTPHRRQLENEQTPQ